MNDRFTIHLAKPENAKTLAQIKERIWLGTYQNEKLGINAADIRAKDFLCQERIAKRAEHMAVNDGVNYTLIARSDDQIVGYGRAVRGEKINKIATLYILPEWQRKGIGSKLLLQLLDWLRNDRDVMLGVVGYNTKAIRFYEKFGFKLGKKISHDEPTFPSGKDLPEIEMLRIQTK